MPQFTEENAVEFARRGGYAKAEREASRGKGLAFLQEKTDELFQDLVRAAQGTGKWKDLPVEKRLMALKLALEYTIGKPRMRDLQESFESDEEENAFSFETAGEANKA